jgi:hypothetical protein
MAMISVRFSDSSQTMVTGYASCAQDESAWPHQGEISTSDSRWKAYYDSQDTYLCQPYLPAPTSE